MPHIIVKLWPGKSEEQKTRLAQEITQSVMSTLQYGEDSVSVAIEEIQSKDWASEVYQDDIVGKERHLYKKAGYKMCGERECRLRGTMLCGANDIRFEDIPDPTIVKPTDAVVRLSATCVCGSDLWSYRGISPVKQPTPMGHEYCGVVEEVGSAVVSISPGQFVIGSSFASDNTCPHCNYGYQ